MNEHPPFSGPESPRAERNAASSKAVLLVGIESSERLLEVKVIQSAGCQCLCVPSAEAGLAQLDVLCPSMVLMDDKAALVDEGRSYSLLRSNPIRGELPLVLLTSHDVSSELIEAGFRDGVDDCIVRPLRADHIGDRLAALRGESGGLTVAHGRRAPRTVILAGGEAPYREHLADLLAHSGYHVLNAPEGESAADAVGRVGGADLLVLVASPSELQGGLLAELPKAGGPAAKGPLPVVVVSEGRLAPSAAPLPSGVHRVDRKAPPEAVVQKVDGLVQRVSHDLRAAARVPFFCPVEFREAGGSVPGPWSSGFSFSVSSGGIFIRTLAPCRAGAALELKIHLTTTREQLSVTGVVAWSNPPGNRRVFSYPVGMGIQFLGIISKKLAQLIALCRAEAPTEGKPQ